MDHDPEFRCNFCYKEFVRREHLARHVQTHTNEKPFECSTCHLAFARVDALSRHCNSRHSRPVASQVTHSIQKVQRACNRCGKAKVRCTGTNPCQRCENNGFECLYDPNRRGLKDKKRQSQKGHQQGPQKQQLPQRQQNDQAPGEGLVNGVPKFQQSAFNNALSMASASEYGNDDIVVDQLSLDQNQIEIQVDCVAMRTPSSMQDHNTQSQTDQDLTFTGPFQDFIDFDDLDFGVGFGETMPALSGIDWAMLDLPDSCHPVAGAMNGLKNSAEIIKGDESQPMLDTLVDAEIEPRKFKMTTITRDAPLVFPDMSGFDTKDLDNEDRAHVDAIGDDCFQPLLCIATRLQTSPFHPPFQRLLFPPAPVMNVFIQLYFEHFHPLLPILHKPTFSPRQTHWLLLFTVAAIGSRYSKLPDSEACSLAMFELARRVSAYMCESDNRRSRDTWMIQAILLINVALMYCGDPRMMEIAELKQSLPVSMGRRKRLFDNLQPSALEQTDLTVHQKWRKWVQFEERRRLGFAIWIMDSNHGLFLNLTNLMGIEELRCQLPCAESAWEATTAQAWATRKTYKALTMKQIFETNSIVSHWSSVGFLAKQAIIHHIFRKCQFYNHPMHSKNPSAYRNLSGPRDQQLTLLSTIQSLETSSDPSTVISNTTTNLRLLLHLVHIVLHGPFPSLPNWVFRRVSNLTYADDAASTKSWMSNCASDCRVAMLNAGQVYSLIRDTNPNGWTDGVVLLYSIFVFWAITDVVLREDWPVTNPSDKISGHISSNLSNPVLTEAGSAHPDFFLDSRSSTASDIQRFVDFGAERMKMKGVGTITTDSGRKRLMEVLTQLMDEREAWGVGRLYARIVRKLVRGNQNERNIEMQEQRD